MVTLVIKKNNTLPFLYIFEEIMKNAHRADSLKHMGSDPTGLDLQTKMELKKKYKPLFT